MFDMAKEPGPLPTPAGSLGPVEPQPLDFLPFERLLTQLRFGEKGGTGLQFGIL